MHCVAGSFRVSEQGTYNSGWRNMTGQTLAEDRYPAVSLDGGAAGNLFSCACLAPKIPTTSSPSRSDINLTGLFAALNQLIIAPNLIHHAVKLLIKAHSGEYADG